MYVSMHYAINAHCTDAAALGNLRRQLQHTKRQSTDETSGDMLSLIEELEETEEPANIDSSAGNLDATDDSTDDFTDDSTDYPTEDSTDDSTEDDYLCVEDYDLSNDEDSHNAAGYTTETDAEEEVNVDSASFADESTSPASLRLMRRQLIDVPAVTKAIGALLGALGYTSQGSSQPQTRRSSFEEDSLQQERDLSPNYFTFPRRSIVRSDESKQ